MSKSTLFYLQVILKTPNFASAKVPDEV